MDDLPVNTSKLYLLSGNGSTRTWWEATLPFFNQLEAVPLELPGFGDNPSGNYQTLGELADALISMTSPGSRIFAVGVNGLVVLRALVKEPEHFSKIILLAPVGAFLWERRFVKFMSLKPVRKIIHFLLRNYPRLFKRKFSSQNWTKEQYRMMGEGYRKCRAFQRYFEIVTAEDALDFLDRIETPVELIWGTRDAVLDQAQMIAWDSILPRAKLTISVKSDWGHYPYIDDPEEFASYIQQNITGFRAHGKAGRLRLAAMGGLPVPSFQTVIRDEDFTKKLAILPENLYALRSSNLQEDHIDSSQAGLNDTFLKVPKQDIPRYLENFFQAGMQEVVVQQYIEPKVAGVAFVRYLSAEVEWVEGHPGELLEGTVSGKSFTYSFMGGDWGKPLSQLPGLPYGCSSVKLIHFLQKVIRLFHYQHADIEWAWDGRQFWLFQIRPVTSFDWQRCLTSANLDEILPKQVSRVMENAQRLAAPHIGKVMGRWDTRVFRDNEPFTTTYADASYINSDLFLARFSDWGLPSSMYAREIGGAVPPLPFRPARFIRNLPVFIRMGFAGRHAIAEIYPSLKRWEAELERIISHNDSSETERENALVRWFCRYYLFIVRTNILINMAVSTSLGSFFSRQVPTVYGDISPEKKPHRTEFESDPATPRQNVSVPDIQPLPDWSPVHKILHKLGIPGLRGRYIQVREWFRDNNMRLFHRFHLAMRDSEWLDPYPAVRDQHGTFWQNGGTMMAQDFGFVIFPGEVTGILGGDIMLVEALEPGHYGQYQTAKGVISLTGGKLSHGATLLRELKKPSAVINQVDRDWIGKRVSYTNGILTLLE